MRRPPSLLPALVTPFAGDGSLDTAAHRFNLHTLTERGVRVPMIVNCPGRVRAAVCDELIDLSDVLPTLAELAGADLPEGVAIDGRSFAPFLSGRPGHPRRERGRFFRRPRRASRNRRSPRGRSLQVDFHVDSPVSTARGGSSV